MVWNVGIGLLPIFRNPEPPSRRAPAHRPVDDTDGCRRRGERFHALMLSGKDALLTA